MSRKEDVFALHAEGVLLVPVFPAKHANHVLDGLEFAFVREDESAGSCFGGGVRVVVLEVGLYLG